MLKKYFHFIAILFSSLILVVIWFFDKKIMGTGESGLPFYNLTQNYNAFKDAWNPMYLGNVNGINVASAPTLWLLSILENVGLPGYLIQSMFFFAILNVSGFSIYLLIRNFFKEIKPRYILFGVFVYWFNSWSMVNVWNRFLNNYFIFWGFLPLAFLVFIKGIEKRDYKYAIVTALLSLLYSFALTSTVFSILLWFIFLLSALFYAVFKGKLWYIFKYFITALVAFIIVNCWWINQLVVYIFSKNLDVTLSSFFTSEGNINTLFALSKRLGLLVNSVRGIHQTFFDYEVGWARIFTSSPMVIVEFSIVIIVLITIYKKRRNINILFFTILWLMSLFLMKGNNPPFGELFLFFFKKVTLFQIFRNPFEKFGFIYSLSFPVLFVVSVSYFSNKFKNKRFTNLFLLLPIFYLFANAFPFLSGLVFTHNINHELFTYKINVPEYYKKVEGWLEETDGRYLALPLDGEGINYQWDNPYSGVELSDMLFSKSGISFNTTIPYFQNYVGDLAANQLSRDILSILPFANIKYIINRSDINNKFSKTANPNITKQMLNSLVEEDILEKQLKEGAIDVYRIKDKYSLPKVFITKNIFILNDSKVSNIFNFIENPGSKKLAIIGPVNNQYNFDFSSVTLPKETFIILVSYPTPKDLSSDDILAKLFYVKHLPGSWYYPLIRIKEFIEEVSQNEYDGWVIYKTGILGKRAAEIYKLVESGAESRIVVKADNDYKLTFEDLKQPFLISIEQGGPVSQLIKNSLLYQWILLERSKSPSASYIYNFLISLGITPKYDLAVSDYDYVIARFNILKSDEYKILLQNQENMPPFLLDGKPSEDKVYLENGIHEITLSSKDLAISDTLMSFTETYFDNSNLPFWNFEIPDKQTKYALEFEYRFIESNSFIIKFTQDIEYSDAPVFYSIVKKSENYHGWSKFDKEFTTSPGASLGKLEIIPDEETICTKQFIILKKCQENDKKFAVEIRNLKFSKINIPKIAVVKEGEKDFLSNTNLQWEMVNPTKYKLNVEKEDSHQEIIVFSELFNPSWKAVMANGDSISENKHFLVNSFANGWLLDQVGSYQIIIEYRPQKYLEFGRKISTGSTILLVGFLFLLTWKEKRRISK